MGTETTTYREGDPVTWMDPEGEDRVCGRYLKRVIGRWVEVERDPPGTWPLEWVMDFELRSVAPAYRPGDPVQFPATDTGEVTYAAYVAPADGGDHTVRVAGGSLVTVAGAWLVRRGGAFPGVDGMPDDLSTEGT